MATALAAVVSDRTLPGEGWDILLYAFADTPQAEFARFTAASGGGC